MLEAGFHIEFFQHLPFLIRPRPNVLCCAMVDCVHRLSVRLLLDESISDILCGLPYPSIIFPLLLPINAFQVTLEGGSNGLATAPAVVTGTFLRESGDPAGITIPLIDISDPSGSQVIQTEIPPDSEDSGSFSITLTDPGCVRN